MSDQMPYAEWAKFFRHEMERLGWSDDDVAHGAGVSTESVRRWKSGEGVPSRASFRRLRQLFAWPEQVHRKGWATTCPV